MNRVAQAQRRAPRREVRRPMAGARVSRPKDRAIATGAVVRENFAGRPSRSAPVPRTGLVIPRFFGWWLLAKLAAVTVLVGGAAIASQVASSRQFQIAEVVVAGNDLVAAEDIAATINVGGMNAFAVRARRLERILRADPAIEGITIKTRLPNTVEVIVHEREPAVVWEANGRNVLSDASGLALRDGARDDLPLIHAPDGPAPDPGDRVDGDAVRMARSLVPRLDSEGLHGGQLEFRPASGASVILPDSARLALGTTDDLEDKLAAYRSIRGFLDQNRTRAQFIDVRFLERPYFR
jgi:hypothetical protein